MTHPKELDGISIALLALGEDENGEDEWWVHAGIGHWDGECLRFRRKSGGVDLVLEPEWLDRLTKVPDELKEIMLEAEFYIPLTVGVLPDEADPDEYVSTGLRQPPKE